MSAPASMPALVERYLRERRRLGFELRSPGLTLRDFARHVQDRAHRGPLTREIMASWARCDSHESADPCTWARRLKQLRPFTRWLQQFEPRTEVPEEAIFGPLPQRQAPHIFSEQEIRDLLAAARRLGPTPGLRGAVFETLFGLIACTGLRISEALALRIADVDLKAGRLTIQRTKFAKSRHVPLHISAVQALLQYRWLRDLSGESVRQEAPFFVDTQDRSRGQPLTGHHVERLFAELRKQLGWRNRGIHYAPRIHDLRHAFVVRRIVSWQAQGVDIDQAMLSLSTYVGHTNVTNTYWYLSAVPELMAQAAHRFEALQLQPGVSHA